MSDHPDFCARHMWNVLTQGPCCQCMTSQQKLDYVWKQMRMAKLSPKNCHIQCPYCLSVVTDGKPCCGVMRKAMAAVLEREDVVCVMMEAANRN
jgi:hypothetical protein